ncbi:hypothetical protein EYF80_030203 [Liparis tanakae]|uniref:Uncharacterized protein n=1 Tax=Liparis tanakae TaxID=230148 RepID=A0A4Z2H392_9TELE|nr:hypothetical protein EYF80_030203 [Liparis tanakae]
MVALQQHVTPLHPQPGTEPSSLHTLVCRGFLSGSDRTKGKSMPLAAERTLISSSWKPGDISSARNLKLNCRPTQ